LTFEQYSTQQSSSYPDLISLNFSWGAGFLVDKMKALLEDFKKSR